MSRPKVALSLRQPWATAVILGGKDVENRTWSTSFRGRVIIHAGLQEGMPGWDWEPLAFWMRALYGGPLPKGAFIGEVDIVHCVPIEALDDRAGDLNGWASGPFCWLLKNPVAYREPIPGKGSRGFFRVVLEEERERGRHA